MIPMITETIISAALLANFITWYFEPLDTIREYVIDKYLSFVLKRKWFWATPAIKIITCPKCLAFWGTLIYTFNLIDAILASMLALFIKWMIEYVAKP